MKASQQKPDHAPKYKRGLSMSEKLHGDLLELCDHLGINPHNYISNEIAKAVQRDRLSLMVKQHQDETLKLLADLLVNEKE